MCNPGRCGLTAAGRADVHDRERRGRAGVGLNVAASPRPSGGTVLQVRGEHAAAATGARGLIRRTEAHRRTETVHLRPPSARERLPP